jgi:hypothetical protein
MYGKDSKEIYKRYLLSEVSQSDLNEIKYQRQLSSLPFNNIFDGKYRVILPVIADETFDMILDKIQQCQAFKFDHFDFAKEKVMIELPVDEKFKHLVKGKKLRAESLNAVIAKMEQTGCVTPEEAAEYSKWVIRFSGEGLRNMGDQSYVILSRSPVDIVRMSDVSGIDSCHGKGGRFYHCALDEAKQDAGFVGFLVKPEQLEKLSKERVREEFLKIISSKNSAQIINVLNLLNAQKIDEILWDLNIDNEGFDIFLTLEKYIAKNDLKIIKIAIIFLNLDLDLKNFNKNFCLTKIEKKFLQNCLNLLKKYNLKNIDEVDINQILVEYSKNFVLNLLFFVCFPSH